MSFLRRKAGLVLFCLIFFFSILFLAKSAQAETFCVNDEAGLQAALDRAGGNGENDVIRIVQGNYFGNFIYAPVGSEPVGLIIEGGYTAGCASRVVDPANTVLDGENSGRVLELNSSGVSADFSVDGLTVQNGNVVDDYGGGIFINCFTGDVTITNCTIRNNFAELSYEGAGAYVAEAGTVRIAESLVTSNEGGDGAGVLIYERGDSPLQHTIEVENNFISDNNSGTQQAGGLFIYGFKGEVSLTSNTVSSNFGGEGGGISIIGNNAGAETVTLTDNAISYNEAVHAGGVYVSLVDDIILKKNRISHNRATVAMPNYGGGGLLIRGRDLVSLTDNVIASNHAQYDNSTRNGTGRGLWVSSYHGTVIVTNNTIVYNTSVNLSGSAVGGGIYLRLYEDACTGNLWNNIIWANNADESLDLYIENNADGIGSSSTVNLCNNDFHQDTSYIQIPFTIDPSNLDNEDPLFVDPANDDYHIDQSSPCRDKGDPNAPSLPLTDFEGDDRIVGPAPDIGADEYAELSPEEQIAAILQFFEASVADGSLSGCGRPWPAKIRLLRMKIMLKFSAILIETGNIELACWELQRACDRCDGQSPPPDLVEGEASPDLAEMILGLMESLGCEQAKDQQAFPTDLNWSRGGI